MKLVADANVLLSAVLGGKARLVLKHPNVETVFTCEAILREVEEYAIILAQKRRLSLDTVLLAVSTLPVSVAEQKTYAHAMSKARRLIGKGDADDVEILALAMHSKVPLWWNDNDFEGAGVSWYTTAELLQQLGISRR